MPHARRVGLVLAGLVAAMLPAWAVTAVPAASAATATNGMLAVSIERIPDQELRHQAIHVVTPSGGSQTWLTQNATYGDAQEWGPRWSPDGNTVAFFRGYGGNFQIALVGADGSNAHTIGTAAGAYKPIWSPDGQWIYYLVQNANGFNLVRLWRMHPDGSAAELVPLPSDVYLRGPYAIAPDGRLVFGGIKGVNEYEYGIFAYDLTQNGAGAATTVVSGTALSTVGETGVTRRIDVSASGQVLFDWEDPTVVDSTCNGFSNSYRTRNLYVAPIAGGTLTQLTHTDGLAGPYEAEAAWSPDETQIVTSAPTSVCGPDGTNSTAALRILSSQGALIRDLPLETFEGASWQPCTASTTRCAPAPVASPSPSPTGSSTASPTATPSSAASASSSTSPSSGSSPTSSPDPNSCPDLQVRVNTPVINATGLASVTVTQATPGADVELQGYSQNHYGTASFDNDPTPVDRVATADDSGVASFDDLRPASNTRLRARLAGCPDATDGSSAVITVRTQLTLAAARVGTRVYAFSGKSIPARPGGLVVGLYRVAGSVESLVAQARANATTGQYSMNVTFPLRDQGQRITLVLKTGRDAQNAAGRSNSRLLLIQ